MFSIYQEIPTIVFSAIFFGAEILMLFASVDLFLNGR